MRATARLGAVFSELAELHIARARDDGGTRRATEATPPVRASKRLSVQVSAAASAFLVNFRLRMDAIASIRSLKFTRNADAAADTCTDSRFDARTGGVASVARRVPPSSRARAMWSSASSEKTAPRRAVARIANDAKRRVVHPHVALCFHARSMSRAIAPSSANDSHVLTTAPDPTRISLTNSSRNRDAPTSLTRATRVRADV